MNFSSKKRLEKQLLRRLKARDPKAFELLIRQYQEPVLNLLYRMLGNKAEAEDLAQEVFVTVFKKIDTFRQEAALSTWIFKIASNQCKNRFKYLARRREERRIEMDESGVLNQLNPRNASLTSAIAQPDQMVEGLQMERLIQDAISSLDDEHRLVLVLRDIQNLTYDEITSITGLPLGTVKSRLHRARMALKDKLASHLR